ncbi:MAG: hypothetical protein AB1485_03985 [Candidatus Thermoplasmatota archaeon]
MQNKDKLEIARKAASAYFGFSKRLDNFPDSMKIDFYDGTKNKSEQQHDNFLVAVNEMLESVWNDEIGSLSKIARLSLYDFAFYVNGLRKNRGMKPLSIDTPGEKEILVKWMRCIVDLNDSVVLVELTYNDKQKYLLVNTAMALYREAK